MNSPCTCPLQLKRMADLCATCRQDYAAYEMWRQIWENGTLVWRNETEMLEAAEKAAA